MMTARIYDLTHVVETKIYDTTGNVKIEVQLCDWEGKSRMGFFTSVSVAKEALSKLKMFKNEICDEVLGMMTPESARALRKENL